MSQFIIVIPGVPIAKARPRVVQSKSGKIYAYIVSRTREAEQDLRQHLMVALRGWQAEPSKAYGLRAFFFFPSNRNKEETGHFHTGRPDLDNLLKLVLDALKPWIEDAQIAMLESQKFYGEKARTELILSELD